MEKEEIIGLIKRIASQKAVVQLSEDDLSYLLHETEVSVVECSTQETGDNRMQFVINELKQQCESIADGYSCFVLQISCHSNHPLMMEELMEFQHAIIEDILVTKQLLWGLVEDESIPSLNVTLIMSRKAVTTLKELVDKYSFQEVIQPLGELYDSTWQPKLQENYEKLKLLVPQSTDESIRIVSRWEGMSPMIDCNASVWDKENKAMKSVALYDDWSKLLFMPIFIDEDTLLTENELLAGLLCDMTYSDMQQ